MRPGEAISLVAFLLFFIIGWLRRVSRKQKYQIAGLGLLGTALISATRVLSIRFPEAARTVGDWLPSLLLLIVYWQAGRFFGAPNQKLQACLEQFDRRWLGDFLEHWERKWSTTWIGTYFEFAYLMCYVLIPLGIAVLYGAHRRVAIDEYWTLVLPAAYVCYFLVPFAQTLPPRLLRPASALPAVPKIRALNLFILRLASIHLNTFPSGHVASVMGASLVLMRFVPGAGILFLLLAVSIAVGAVAGRYHYALDVILGAVLPIGIACLAG